MTRLASITILCGLAAPLSTAKAQWVTTNLHPAGSTHSEILGGSGGQQVGVSYNASAVPLASLWSGTAASWASLAPAGSTGSTIYSMSGGRQFGWAVVGGSRRAGFWSGTAASWVNLDPALSTSSLLVGGTGGVGGIQYGTAQVDGPTQASMWSGTAASWVSMAPPGVQYSSIIAAAGNQQVGEAGLLGGRTAAIWMGSAGSYIDLFGPPLGGYPSIAQGTDGVQQVGMAVFVGNIGHAMLWTGSAASAVDLDPGGHATPVGSVAFAVSGGIQVGRVNIPATAQYHACLWMGTAASIVDLHAFLPTNFDYSVAQSVWSDAGATYIGGDAHNTTTNRLEAILWTRPAACYANCDGSTTQPALNVLDFACFLNKFAAGDTYANCDHSTTPPILNVLDFACFLNQFAAGCP